VEIKVTVVGSNNVGKTSLLISYTTNTFPTEYVPTVFDNYCAKAVVEGSAIDLILFDTAGNEEYDSMRPLNYPGTDVFLLCFSVLSPDSAEQVIKKWVDEIRSQCTTIPILLVGTKIDLRENSKEIAALKSAKGRDPITKEQGKQLADAIGACGYVECSALTQAGLNEVFNTAMKVKLFPPKELPKASKDKAKECSIQ